MADFRNGLIFRIFGVFLRFFVTELLWCGFRINLYMLFGIVVFDPNRSFRQIYRLCMMADFHIGLVLDFGIW